MMKLEGGKEAERAFKKLEQAVRIEAVKKGLESAGEVVREDMFNKTPVKGGTSEDGFYRSEGKQTPRSGAVRKSIKVGSVKDGNVRVGTNNIIALDLEMGTSRESAKPFARRSADDSQTQNGVAKAFNDAIKEAVK